MKLTVLVDNNTYIDKYYFGEPALSFYIENEQDKILFDLGYSDIFQKNASLMGINLAKVNKISFSHGHNDHTGGLKYFNHSAEIITHPHTFKPRKDSQGPYGSFIKESEVKQKFNLSTTTGITEISKNLFYLGEIPMQNNFEFREDLGLIDLGDKIISDFTLDDSALVYKNQAGLHIIAGCSHSGICNIIEHAKKSLKEEKIALIIGGFHIFTHGDHLDRTIQYFRENNIQQLYPCHCVSFEAKAVINNYIKIQEVGVGLSLDFE